MSCKARHVVTLDHNAILRDAARRTLRPLGLTQKGRSRSWIDDHGWWLINVEFQPSGFQKGSYLNVGPQHLWAERDYFVFENGARMVRERGSAFVGVREGASGFEALVELAARRVVELRDQHGDGLPALRRLAGRKGRHISKDVWDLLNAGVAAGLAGEAVQAALHLDRILQATTASAPAWQQELAADVAGRWRPALSDADLFRTEARTSVERCRQLLKLPPVPIAFT